MEVLDHRVLGLGLLYLFVQVVQVGCFGEYPLLRLGWGFAVWQRPLREVNASDILSDAIHNFLAESNPIFLQLRNGTNVVRHPLQIVIDGATHHPIQRFDSEAGMHHQHSLQIDEILNRERPIDVAEGGIRCIAICIGIEVDDDEAVSPT